MRACVPALEYRRPRAHNSSAPAAPSLRQLRRGAPRAPPLSLNSTLQAFDEVALTYACCSSRATPHPGALPPQQPAPDAAACPRQPSTPCCCQAALRRALGATAQRSSLFPWHAGDTAELVVAPRTTIQPSLGPRRVQVRRRQHQLRPATDAATCPSRLLRASRQPSVSRRFEAALSRPPPGGRHSGCCHSTCGAACVCGGTRALLRRSFPPRSWTGRGVCQSRGRSLSPQPVPPLCWRRRANAEPSALACCSLRRSQRGAVCSRALLLPTTD